MERKRTIDAVCGTKAIRRGLLPRSRHPIVGQEAALVAAIMLITGMRATDALTILHRVLEWDR